jgi:hypothetical protein
MTPSSPALTKALQAYDNEISRWKITSDSLSGFGVQREDEPITDDFYFSHRGDAVIIMSYHSHVRALAAAIEAARVEDTRVTSFKAQLWMKKNDNTD